MKTIWFPSVVKNIFIKSICNSCNILIPVQSTAKGRRIWKHRGQGPAQNGRRHVDKKKKANGGDRGLGKCLAFTA